MKDITSINEKEEICGYWEGYLSNGKLSSKGNFINGKFDGYWKIYCSKGKLN